MTWIGGGGIGTIGGLVLYVVFLGASSNWQPALLKVFSGGQTSGTVPVLTWVFTGSVPVLLPDPKVWTPELAVVFAWMPVLSKDPCV